jgi:competence protein ComEC
MRLREPLLIPAGALGVGIFLDDWLRFDAGVLALAAAAFGLLSAIAAFRAKIALALLCASLALAAVGASRHASIRGRAVPTIEAESREMLVLSGCVVDPPALHAPRDRTRFLLEFEPGAIAQVSLYLREDETPPAIRYGERIEFEGRLRPVRNFRNPGSFDFAHYMARRGIYWTASARVDTKIERQGDCGNPLSAAVFYLRGSIEERIERLFPGDSYASTMLSAILIGQTEGLERSQTEDFRRTGTYHALVVSGMHFTALTFLMGLGFQILSVRASLRLVLGIAAGWLYTALCGFNAPVVRAAGALTLYLIGRWMFRRVRLLNALAAVAIAYLLWDPEQLFEASFQLSFAAVGALGALVEPWMEATTAIYANALRKIDKLGRDFRVEPAAAEFRVELRLLAETLSLLTRIPTRWTLLAAGLVWRGLFTVFEMLSISLLMQISLLIPMAAYFHRVNWSGLTANLVVTPLLTFVVPLGFAAMATGSGFLAAFTRFLLEIAAGVAHWHLIAMPWLDRRIPDAPGWAIVVAAVSLGTSVLVFRLLPRWRWVAFPVAVAALFGLVSVRFEDLSAYARPSLSASTGMLELTLIDVGQGDGILAVFPGGTRMLVDGGGIVSFDRRRKSQLDTGEDVVSPYLWRRRFDRVDIIASTHAHDDHIGGLPALIENFRPREIWTGALPARPSESWSRVLAAAAVVGAKVLPMRDDAVTRRLGGATVDVLSPPRGYEAGETAKNNDSLVLALRFGRRAFLLTGDLEKQMEAALVESGKLRGRFDVLKVGHHGSRTSTTALFLEAVQPRLALISAGVENTFRHPHPAVVRSLEERGIAVLRTDQHGLVQVKTDGVRLEVHTPAISP